MNRWVFFSRNLLDFYHNFLFFSASTSLCVVFSQFSSGFPQPRFLPLRNVNFCDLASPLATIRLTSSTHQKRNKYVIMSKPSAYKHFCTEFANFTHIKPFSRFLGKSNYFRVHQNQNIYNMCIGARASISIFKFRDATKI